MAMTKKNYESLEKELFDIVHHTMGLDIEYKGKRMKATLQDIIAVLADEFQKADPKFDRQRFYIKTGALQYLQNS